LENHLVNSAILMMNYPNEMISFLRSAKRVVALTGAGVSQESGLHTFRDAQLGLWEQYRPEDLATPQAFQRDPKLVWEWYAMRREMAKTVEPNPGHYALAEMARRIPDFILITQNVDGLHHKAGNPDVIELHGNLQRVKCFDCGKQVQVWDETDGLVPRCPSCGGLLRPDVVWFGEQLPLDALERAVEATRRCQIFLSVGTSGLVQPAASLAVAAKNRGGVVIEINAEPTPLSAQCDYVIHGKSGEILPELVRKVWL
jgi:NAD-dependent deacetylase